jgi:hypothetical protein
VDPALVGGLAEVALVHLQRVGGLGEGEAGPTLKGLRDAVRDQEAVDGVIRGHGPSSLTSLHV